MTLFETYPQKWPFFDPFLTFFSLFWHLCQFCRLNQERTQFGTPKMTLFWPILGRFLTPFLPFSIFPYWLRGGYLSSSCFCRFSCSFLKCHVFWRFFVIFCHFWQFTRAICLVFGNHHFRNIPQNRRFLTVFCHFWTHFGSIFDHFLTPFQKWTLFFMSYHVYFAVWTQMFIFLSFFCSLKTRHPKMTLFWPFFDVFWPFLALFWPFFPFFPLFLTVFWKVPY